MIHEIYYSLVRYPSPLETLRIGGACALRLRDNTPYCILTDRWDCYIIVKKQI
jgi:hypothetical protein